MDAFVEAWITEQDGLAQLLWGKQIVKRSNGPDVVQLMEAAWTTRVEDCLSQIFQPSLLIHGRHDQITCDDVRGFSAALPNAKLVVFEDAGQVRVITRPELVAHEIEEFSLPRRRRTDEPGTG